LIENVRQGETRTSDQRHFIANGFLLSDKANTVKLRQRNWRSLIIIGIHLAIHFRRRAGWPNPFSPVKRKQRSFTASTSQHEVSVGVIRLSMWTT